MSSKTLLFTIVAVVVGMWLYETFGSRFKVNVPG